MSYPAIPRAIPASPLTKADTEFLFGMGKKPPAAPPAPVPPAKKVFQPQPQKPFEEDDLGDIEEVATGIDMEVEIPSAQEEADDAIAAKRNRLDAVRYTLSSVEKIDYNTWAYLTTQLRFSDRPELLKLTKALLPGTQEWHDDGYKFTFKAAGAPCEIDTLAGCLDVLVNTGDAYPYRKPVLFEATEENPALDRQLPLAQAYFEAVDDDDYARCNAIAKELGKIDGKVDTIKRRIGGVYKEVLEPDATYYVDELKKAYRRYEKACTDYETACECNPKAVETARTAHGMLANLFPDDMQRFEYSRPGSRSKEWLCYDAFIDLFDQPAEENSRA